MWSHFFTEWKVITKGSYQEEITYKQVKEVYIVAPCYFYINFLDKSWRNLNDYLPNKL